VEEKRLTVQVNRVPAGYELSFRLPTEVYFTEALKHGFGTKGSHAHVVIDSSTLFIRGGKADWIIHHEDNAGSSPEKVRVQVEDALREWLGRLGYEVQFQSD